MHELTGILLYPAISSTIPSTQIPTHKSTDASEETAAASAFSDAVQIAGLLPGQKSCSTNSRSVTAWVRQWYPTQVHGRVNHLCGNC